MLTLGLVLTLAAVTAYAWRLRRQQGRVEAVAAAMNSERRRAEQDLQRTVATLRGVLDNAQVAVIATSEDGLITLFNPGAERLLGWTAAEMLGCSPLAFHDHAELAGRSEDGVARFETLVNFEASTAMLSEVWTWVDRWGGHHPVQVAIRRQPSEGGSSGYVWVAVDLTALRAEESERREVGQRLQKLAAQIPGAVFQFRVHADGRHGFPYVSPGVEGLMGFTARELMADWKRLVDVVHPEDLPMLRGAVFTGSCVFRVRRGGQTRWLLGLSSPEKEADGSLVLHGFVTDITEQKRTEAQLELAREQALAASRVKSDFLANMSHEIRTPLNGILGLTQLVLETTLDGGQRESLETVLRSGNTLLTLLNDILDLTRVESGHLTLESVPLRLDALLAEVTAVVGPAASEKDHRPMLPGTLQAVLRSRGEAPSSVIPAARTDHPRLSVLVAEDNLINAKVVTTLLRRDGHWVVHVPDGRAAVAAFTSTAFDLVLMDVQMPELDGLGATRAIRTLEHQRGGRVSIIALTASAMKGDIDRCLEAGMDAFLPKPLNLAALRELIQVTASRRSGGRSQLSAG